MMNQIIFNKLDQIILALKPGVRKPLKNTP